MGRIKVIINLEVYNMTRHWIYFKEVTRTKRESKKRINNIDMGDNTVPFKAKIAMDAIKDLCWIRICSDYFIVQLSCQRNIYMLCGIKNIPSPV